MNKNRAIITEDVSQFITKQIKNIKQSNPEIIKRKDTENLITKQLDILYQLDQTSNKQYSSHIVKMAIDYDCLNYPSTNIRGRKFIYFCKVIDAYFDFIVNYGLRNYGVKIIKINKFKILDELRDWVRESAKKVRDVGIERKTKNKKEFNNVLINDDKYKITLIKDFAEIRTAFKGTTKWCSAKDEGDFDKYIAQGILVVFEDKTRMNDNDRFFLGFINLIAGRKPSFQELKDINNKNPDSKYGLEDYVDSIIKSFEKTQGLDVKDFGKIYEEKTAFEVYLSLLSEQGGFTIMGDKVLFKDNLSLSEEFISYSEELDKELRSKKIYCYGGLSLRGYSKEITVQELSGGLDINNSENLTIIKGEVSEIDFGGDVKVEFIEVDKIDKIFSRDFNSFEFGLGRNLSIETKIKGLGISKIKTGEGNILFSSNKAETSIDIINGQKLKLVCKNSKLTISGKGSIFLIAENSKITIDKSVDKVYTYEDLEDTVVINDKGKLHLVSRTS